MKIKIEREPVGKLFARTFAAMLVAFMAGCGEDFEVGLDDIGDPAVEEVASVPIFAEAPAGDEFYLPPDPMVGENGDLLWITPLPDADNGTIDKILYRSQSLQGEPIVVSGWIAIPDTPPPEDGYPIVSFGHGTVGVADICAPTIASTPVETIALLEEFLERGFVVVASDYEGLGTPGLHPYVIGTSEAYSMLDAARAAQIYAGGSDNVILFGHSQGGHAIVFANELAASYAPELNILGAIGSGSGVSDSDDQLLEFLKTSAFKGFIVMTGVSQNAGFGDVESPLSRWFTPFGIEASRALESICVSELVSTYAGLDGNAIFAPGAPLPLNSDLYDLDEHTRPGLRIGASPLLLIHGRFDSTIRPNDLLSWAQSTCDIGQTIQLEWFDTGHRVPYIAPQLVEPVIFQWIADRLSGEPPPSNCANLPTP